MLKRVHVMGYRSLADVEVKLAPLTVLFGPNAAGKSNFLDALRLLSRLGTSRTVRDAFDSPSRGTPLESFSMGPDGRRGLIEQERLVCSIEADLQLSEAVVDGVHREISNMRRAGDRTAPRDTGPRSPGVHARNLRYRIEIEMLPRSGTLRVADEYLAPLTTRGELTGKRKPFLAREGDKLHLRLEGRAHATHHDRFLDHSILSMPHYPPHHPHLVAARRELEKLAVLLLRATAADAGRRPRRGNSAHRTDGGRTGRVPPYGEGGRSHSLRLYRTGVARPHAERRPAERMPGDAASAPVARPHAERRRHRDRCERPRRSGAQSQREGRGNPPRACCRTARCACWGSWR